MFLLGPDDWIRFIDSGKVPAWTVEQGVSKSSIVVHGWDLSDQSSKAHGPYNLIIPKKDNDACRYLPTSMCCQKFLIMQVKRTGCDLSPGSTKVNDSCGKCGGDNSTCVGCDNVPYSGAKWGMFTIFRKYILFRVYWPDKKKNTLMNIGKIGSCQHRCF